MVSSLSKYSPICGEANIVRYLSRVGPKEYSYDTDVHQSNQDDIILDVCYTLSKKLSQKDRQSYLQQLNKRLANQQYFNEDLSVVDVAVSSILKQLQLKELPGNLSSWMSRVSLQVGY